MIDRRNISNLYHLSPLQEGMLYHALRAPQSRAYFEQIDFELPGALDAPAYLQAWQDLVARHDILRTVFAVRKLPQPLQIVLRSAPLAPLYEDLEALAPAAAEARIAAHRERDLEQGFDLTAAVPMRLALFRLGPQRHRVVWSFHHILLDGWSLAILQSDLDALYAARLAGRTPALAPPAPFSAYIKWLGQRERGAGLAFWRERLQGVRLPTPVPRRLEARFANPEGARDGAECRHALGPQARAALPLLAARHGVTVNLVVQCLWGMLLARLNGRRDAVFAATVSGRPPELPEAGRTVGLFINAVPVRVELRPGESVATLLARMQAEAIEAQAWHDTPLPDVQAAHPLREALFDHILVFENYPQDAQPAQPAAVSLHEHTHYDFEFQFLPGAAPVLRWRFDRQLFDPAGVARLGPCFEELLLAADADAGRDALSLALSASAWRAPASLALAASFSAEPVADAVEWWCAQFACPLEVRLAPYNQCVAQLGQPDSVLRQAELGVLLLRFEDAARDLAGLPAAEAAARLDAQCALLLELVARRGGQPLCVVLLPGAAEDAHLQALEARWRDGVRAFAGVSVVDLRRPDAFAGLDQLFDPAADRIGHLPYSEAAFEMIGAAVARAALARARAPFKVLAVDCDNTLWGGVVGEAGALGVRIEAGHLALQRFLLARQAEGFLIALTSKNREADVWEVFERHPDMLLRREHIAAAAIDWQPKSGNLRRLAAQLNLGVDSFIFIDDSPVECSEVMENCPEALAIALPADCALYGDWLARVWAFDLAAVTAEDRERTGMMQAEAQRQALAGSDPQSFLAQLQLRVKVGPMQPHQAARVAQLTQRTNQFNLSGRRRSEADIAALAATPGVAVLAVEVEDRFGAYGLTGAAIVRSAAPALCVDTLLLSCRVLGRKVEHALLAALARHALALGHARIEAPLVASARNEPVRLFLNQAPWQSGDGALFHCMARDAAGAVDGVELLDGHLFAAPAAPAPAPAAPADARAAPVPAHASWPAFPLPIRHEARLRHALHYLPLLASCAGWPQRRPQRRRSAAAGARAPAPGTETALAAIWSEVLGQPVAAADVHFTELGGHSLHAVRTVARIERAFGRAPGLSAFFELGSIAALAAWIDAQPAGAPAALAPIAPAPAAPDYPLAHNQQRLWILSQMGAAANLYNLGAAYRLRGPLDVPALRRAVLDLVRQHDALHSVIPVRDGVPRMAPRDAHPGAWTALPAAPGSDAETVRAHVAARGRAPFDLEHGPLFAAELHALGAEDHVLALYLHHLVADGWSFGLLLDGLARWYAHHSGGGPAPAAPPLRYRDFAHWSRSAEAEAALRRQRDYWHAQLQPLAPIAQLAPDHPRPAVPGTEGASVLRTLAPSAAALQSGVRQSGLYPLLASLVALLLYRCSGEPNVRLGMPVAGRDRPELEQTIGFFANTVVLAASLDQADSFGALLQQMQRRVAGALEHQAYPFDRLVAELQPQREPGRNPLFDVLVVLQNARGQGAALPGIEVEDFAADSALAAFELVFEFAETPSGGLACALRYRRDMFGDDSAARLLERLHTLLDAALATPQAALHALALCGPAERAQLERFGSGPVRPLPQLTMDALFARQAAATPDARALADAATRLDYKSADQRANAVAWQLREQAGVGSGEVVAVMLERDADWPLAMLGVLKAGAVYLPLDPRQPAARRDALLRQAGARVLLAAPQTHVPGVTLLTPATGSWAEAPPPPSHTPDSPAYLIFTSGSTGLPKGVRVSHHAFVNMIVEQAQAFGLGPDDVVLQLASCAFDASLSELFMAWAAGACVAVADHASAREPALLRQAIRDQGATVATITPSHLRQLDPDDLAGLRTVILAAEAAFGHDARRLQERGIACFNAYGPTETAVCATLGRVDRVTADAAPLPIGRPLANLRLVVADPHGQPAPLGVPGELLVEGAGVALGYLDDESNSAFYTLPDGSRGYRTGDLCRWRGDGQLEYVGRRDGQLKIRGHRVEPAEIAARLAAIDGVRQAAVVAEDGPAGAFLAAYLCGARRSDAELSAQLGDQLPAHMLPARYLWLERLPLTANGKLDRTALGALAPSAETVADPALNPFETALLAVWRALLPGPLQADQDFFAAGGNSLLAMAAARRISQELGAPCQALQFFRTPTVRSMAAALARPAAAPRAERFGGGALTVLALPPHPGLDLGYPALARAWPEATLHVAPFADKPLAALVDDYLALCAALPAPLVLLGYSGGGRLALALAAALERAGHTPRAVLLIDTWRWTDAAPETIARIDAGADNGHPDGAAYRARLAECEPNVALRAPLHHLLAAELPAAPPHGMVRDWRHLARAGYAEYPLPGNHQQLLSGGCLIHTASLLRTLVPAPPARP